MEPDWAYKLTAFWIGVICGCLWMGVTDIGIHLLYGRYLFCTIRKVYAIAMA
jgi:hypothetical protein